MKILIKYSAVMILFLQVGCGVTKNTFYLQNININAPTKAPSVHITNGQKAGSFTITPEIYLNTNKNIQAKASNHTSVNSNGIFQVDSGYVDGKLVYFEADSNSYDFNGKNLTWNFPDYKVGINLDYCLSDRIAFDVGMNFTSKSSTSLIGWNAGLGFFKQNKNNSIRVDVGVTWQQVQFDALTVVKTEYVPYGGTPQEPVFTFFNDVKKENYLNPYIALTYNSCYQESPINFYINLSYFIQTLFDFTPSTLNSAFYPFNYVTSFNEDLRGDGSASFIGFSPGIYFDLDESTRLVTGVNILKEVELDNSSQSIFVSPMVQLNVIF